MLFRSENQERIASLDANLFFVAAVPLLPPFARQCIDMRAVSQMERKNRALDAYQQLCWNVGLNGNIEGVAATQHRYQLSRGFVRYWTTKAGDPAFHRGELGGAHNSNFTADGELAVEHQLWKMVRSDPNCSAASYARQLRDAGIPVQAE